MMLIERSIVKQQEKLFELWHRVRDGTLKRCEFQLLVEPIRNSIKSSLQEAADYEIGSKEKTPLAKTVRTCRQILKFCQWLLLSSNLRSPRGRLQYKCLFTCYYYDVIGTDH